MMPTVNISETTFARLQKLAIPLVDDIDSVIAKLLDQSSENAPTSDFEPRAFNPSAPPNLAFSSIKSAAVAGKPLDKAVANWNGLMMAVIREVHATGVSAEEIYDEMTVNAAIGQKEDNGYKFLPDVGLSVQGQDANAAFRQAYKLAQKGGISLDVSFVWSDVEKAANPGMKGRLKA